MSDDVSPPTAPPPPGLLDRRRRTPKPMSRLEKAGWILAFTLTFVIAITLLIPGGDGGGYLWVLFLSGVIQFWQHNWGTILLMAATLWLGVLIRAPTVTIVLHGDSKRRPRMVWYRPGSFKIKGSTAQWRTLHGDLEECNASFVRQTGILGGYSIMQVVERHATTDGAIYETVKVEGLRSQVLEETVRYLREELSATRLQRRDRRQPE